MAVEAINQEGVSIMNDTLDMFLLLSTGRLPLSAIDPTQLPNALTAVYRAFEYVLSKPHTFPLVVSDVQRVAVSRFHAKSDAVELFTQLSAYAPSAATVESVQQSILLRKIVAEASDQIATGKYNLPAIGTFASHVTSFGVSSLVKQISAPAVESKDSARYITGIDVVDNVIGGVRDELVVVSARPKNGKSNFFVNLVCLSPRKRFLYVTVADYGYNDLCQVLYDCVPAVVKRSNIHIADFTSFGATVVDVETAIRETSPDIIIVDRAEKLVPLVKAREPRWELAKIFETLRQYAKRYHVPMFVDAQQSDSGSEWTRRTDQVSPDSMAEDKTGRFAMLDLFIGLQRKAHAVKLHIVGRRKSLPADVEVRTNEMGRYMAER